MAPVKILTVRYRVFRPETYHTLCQVRSAGHYSVCGEFHDAVMKKDFLELFWCMDGSGYFVLDGKTVKLSCGEVFCYFPGDIHQVYTNSANWNYYWITLDGCELSSLLRVFGLQRGAWSAGPCPVDLFEKVISSLSVIGGKGLHQASSAAYEILNFAANGQIQEDELTVKMKNCLEENSLDPAFSIVSAARKLGMHRSSLHRLFVRQFRMSPQDYLTACRLREAVRQMKGSMPLKEIAFACGFSDQNYFTRVFRLHYGIPPGKFRQRIMHAEPEK